MHKGARTQSTLQKMCLGMCASIAFATSISCSAMQPAPGLVSDPTAQLLDRGAAMVQQNSLQDADTVIPLLRAVVEQAPESAAGLRARQIVAYLLAMQGSFGEGMAMLDAGLALPAVTNDDRLLENWRWSAVEIAGMHADRVVGNDTKHALLARLETYLVDVLPVQPAGPMRMGAPSFRVVDAMHRRARTKTALSDFAGAEVSSREGIAVLEQSLVPAGLATDADVQQMRWVLAAALAGACQPEQALATLMVGVPEEGALADLAVRGLNAEQYLASASPSCRAGFVLQVLHAMPARNTIGSVSLFVMGVSAADLEPGQAAQALVLAEEFLDEPLRQTVDEYGRSFPEYSQGTRTSVQLEPARARLRVMQWRLLSKVWRAADAEVALQSIRTDYADSQAYLAAVGIR
jgi:hypothetical protein